MFSDVSEGALSFCFIVLLLNTLLTYSALFAFVLLFLCFFGPATMNSWKKNVHIL